MIDEEGTFKKFGYYSTDLKPKSGKKIIAVCDIGGEIRELTKQNYRPICINCIRKTSEYHKNASRAQKKRFEDPKERGKISVKITELWKDDNYREMICIAQTGKKLSEEHKEKLKGRIPWNKGKTGLLSEETLMKMSESHVGNEVSEKTRIKISKTLTGHEISDTTKVKISETLIGHEVSGESKIKMSEAHIGKKNTEESKEKNRKHSLRIAQNQRWNAQITNFINGNPITDWIQKPSRHYGISQEEYDIWRHEVYERDRYTCQICGVNHCEVHAHHIIPQRINQDLILDINNGITMCRTCHEMTYGKEELFIDELQMIINGTI